VRFNKRNPFDWFVLVLLAFGLWLACERAHATTYLVSPGASTASIQSVFNTAGSASGANTILFGAGTYNITSVITIPCAAGTSLTITGPTVPYSTTHNQTAVLFGPVPGFFGFQTTSGCTKQTTIQYLEWNGGQPSPDGGGFLYISYGTSNLTVTNNYLHGNNTTENTNINDGLIEFGNGTNIGNGFAFNANVTVSWNIFGNGTWNQSTFVYTGDCAPVQAVFDEWYSENGGYCNSVGIHANLQNVSINNNIMHYQEEPIKIFEGSELMDGLNTFYNDFSFYHRIGIEVQAGSGTSGGPPSGPPPMNFDYNDVHDLINPLYGTWGFSLPNGTINADQNVMVSNFPTYNAGGKGGGSVSSCPASFSTGYCIPGAFEFWGNGHENNNLIQGTFFGGMALGYNSISPSTNAINYSIACGYYIGGYGTAPVHNLYGPEEAGVGAPSQTIGNVVVGTGTCPQTSVAPTISPSSGSYSSPLTVTLTDTGVASGGTGPQGNTTIYYTTDGSTPTTNSASCNASTTGTNSCTISVSTPLTVKAIGMWGSINQPGSYPSGYGFVPSAVATAAYTASGGVTLVSVSLTNQTAIHAMVAGGTLQMTANCLYSNAVTTNCNTTDAYGNSVSNWTSSNTAVLTINGSGLMTGVGAGTANVTAVVGSFTTPNWAMTVNSATLPLSSVALATTGGISSLVAGQVNQLLATCTYTDSSTTNCATADVHGNAVNPWTSAAPSTATVNSTGVATAVAAGSTNFTATVNPSMVTSQWGQTAYSTAGTTQANFLQMNYLLLGNQPGGYSGSGGTCSFYLPSGTLTVGALYDCGLIVAPTPTTEASSWLCYWTYTVSSTSAPGGFVSGTMSNCGTLTAGEALWVTTTTNQSGASPAGFYDCGGTCTGAAPTSSTGTGVGTYPYYCVQQPYGSRTGLPSTVLDCGTGQHLQTAQYVTLGQPPIVSNTVPLSVTAAGPTLVSASLTTPGSANTMIVGGTLQFAAKCLYSDSSTTDCTVADIHGNAVTLWTTSNAALVTIGAVGSANPGLATAVAAGSPTIQANVGAAVTTPTFGLTISNPAVTLTSLSLATTGGITGLFVGSTNQLIAICGYSDGSHTNCTSTDSHGNKASTYVSSTPGYATVGSTTGLVTGVAVGTTTLTGVAGSFTSTAIPLTVLAVPSGIYVITISGPVKFSGTVHF
jgi:Chitobiase/beta-hexosaminidase C-terminal domain/Bacterial Ig-like domain (group 2)